MEFLLLLLIKHAIIDLGVQSQLHGINKSNYFGNAHEHYLHHGISTLVIAGLCLPAVPAILCAIIDYFIHWQIDYAKHKVNNYLKIAPRSIAWWWTNVIDQCLHFLTYYFLVIYFNALSF
jgi:hypothetical protein